MGIITNRKKAAEKKAKKRERQIEGITALKNNGWSNVDIARLLDIPESTVRSLVK